MPASICLATPEVDEHDAVSSEHEVLRLDVAVHDRLVVHVLQRLARLLRVGDRRVGGQAGVSVSLQHRREVRALDEVHHEELVLAILEVVAHVHDAWMAEALRAAGPRSRIGRSGSGRRGASVRPCGRRRPRPRTRRPWRRSRSDRAPCSDHRRDPLTQDPERRLSPSVRLTVGCATVEWVEVFAVFVVSHLVGDFLLQTDWQARHKRGGLGAGPGRAARAASHTSPRTRSRSCRRSSGLADEIGAGATLGDRRCSCSVRTWSRTTAGCSRAYVRTVKRSNVPEHDFVFIACDQSFHVVALLLAALVAAA